MIRKFMILLAALALTASPASAALQLYPIDGLDGLPEIDDGSGPLKFDFKPFKIATRYDGATCKFAINRIDNDHVSELVTGMFTVDAGHLKFNDDAEWQTGGLATPDSFKRANLALTEKGQLVGRVPVYHLFVNPGMVPPEAELVSIAAKDGSFAKELPVGVIKININRDDRGQFVVDGCNPPGVNGPILPYFDFSKVTLADTYDGLHCDFTMKRLAGGSQELGHGHLEIGRGGHLVFLDGMWETNGPPESYKTANLAFTADATLIGRLDFYGLFPDDHSSNPPPFPISLKGEGKFDKETLTGSVRFPLDDMTGLMIISRCR